MEADVSIAPGEDTFEVVRAVFGQAPCFEGGGGKEVEARFVFGHGELARANTRSDGDRVFIKVGFLEVALAAIVKAHLGDVHILNAGLVSDTAWLAEVGVGKAGGGFFLRWADFA